MLKIGFLTLQQLEWSELVDHWQTLEGLGADSLWLCDHMLNRFSPESSWLDGWTALAGLAQVTRSVRIGMLLSAPVLHHPAKLVKQIVTVDHISGGRLEVGLGAGGYQQDHDLMGLDWPTELRRPKSVERSYRLAEWVEVIDLLLRGSIDSYDGRFYRFTGAHFRPPSLQNPYPPITIGGHARSTMELAARYASRWNLYGAAIRRGLPALLRQVETCVTDLRNACAEVSRDPREIVRSILMPVGPLPVNLLSSRTALEDFSGRMYEADIQEVILFYPLDGHFGGLAPSSRDLGHLLG